MVKHLSLLLILFICGACGNDVKISGKKLEYNSSLSDGTKADKSGMLIRGRPDRLAVNGSQYTVSIYSSHSSLEFIASKPLSTQIAVLYNGKLVDGEMVLEVIQAQ